MANSQKALHDFLNLHCDIKPISSGKGTGKERCYVLKTEDCLLFMAETHVQEMRNIVDQTDEVVAAARKSGDYSEIIMAYNWEAPDPGMDTIRIPIKLVESLDEKRALMILRHLEGIQRDIDEGCAKKAGLQALFGDTATVRTSNNLDGERVYMVTGKASVGDRRRYAERYAEQVATNVLFDLPKALNAKLQTAVPADSRGRFFVEGRDITARKVRYGADINIEIVLTEEGASIYTDLSSKDARIGEAIGKIMRQAMTDPFGLSLKYYMGKHAIIKINDKDAKPPRPKK